jgi:effector-binding domain-containing protein
LRSTDLQFPIIMADIEIVVTKAQSTIAIREKVRSNEIPQAMERMFNELIPLLNQGVQCCGPPFTLYHSWSEDETDMEVGFPVVGQGIQRGRVRPMELPSVKAAVTMHIGPYDKLMETYNKMMEWMMTNGHQPADYMWEEYLNSPQDTPSEKLMTRLIWPLK